MIKNIVITPKEADGDISNILEKVVTIIKESNVKEHIYQLYLGGGFGRGEGSVVCKDGTYCSSNDFDLFAIVDQYTPDITNIESKIEYKLNIKDCDIAQILISKMKFYYHKDWIQQANFDFLKGSILIWENNDFISNNDVYSALIKKCFEKSYSVNFSSAYDNLRTRVYCLIATMKIDRNGYLFPDLSYKDKTFIYFQLVKAATSIVDSICIVESVYDSPRFERKLELFKKTNFGVNNDIKLVCDLITDKIYNRNDISNLTICNIAVVKDLYVKACLYVMEYSLPKYYLYKVGCLISRFYYSTIKHRKKIYNPPLSVGLLLTDVIRNKRKILKWQQVLRSNYKA